MSGCCVDSVIDFPKTGIKGPQGVSGDAGIQGVTGNQGANGINGGQEVYQTRKIVFNSPFVPNEVGGSLVSDLFPFTVTLLNATQLGPSGGPNMIPGGLLSNVFYNMGNGQDSSGPYDYDIQIWWAQSLNSGVFTSPCHDAKLLKYVKKMYIDIADNALKIDVTHFGVYRMVILG